MKVPCSLLIALLLFLPTLTRADDLGGRIEVLEKNQAEIYHSLGERKEAGVGAAISENVTMSGLVEVEIIWENVDETGTDKSTSKIDLATAQIGFEAAITEGLEANIIFLFEEDENTEGADVDEATIDYFRANWFLSLGILELPTGFFPSHMLSGPLTEDLGEARETGIIIGYEMEGFTISGWLANGDFEEAGDEDHIDDMGLSFMVTPSEGFEFGATYFNDMADTDAELVGPAYIDQVAGLSAYFVLEFRGLEILGEYLGAADDFNPGDLEEDGDGNGDSPSAWNAEIAVGLGENLEIAARVGGSSEWADEPESQVGACLSYGVWRNVSLSVEYLHEEFGSAFSSIDSRDSVTTQFAVEF